MTERKKILIVDDVATNRLLLKQMLSTLYDYDLVEAANGQDAVVLYETESPDLILMDVMMPGVNGYQATTQIKDKMGDVHVPIIFLTALSSDDALEEALSSGGDDFISKPFNLGILQSKINAHLRIRDLTKQLNAKNNILSRFNQRLIQEQELIEYFFENAIKQSYLDEKLIKYHMSSLSAFNGDILLTQRSPNGSLYVIVGDFTGHGLSAAMGTLPIAMIFFGMVKKGLSAGDIAREINIHLFKVLPGSMFFVASILEIDPRNERMMVWTSGMPESYIFNKNDKLTSTIHAQHMPLGIVDDNEFDSLVQTFEIKRGEKVYLCSDGVVEARNMKGEMFGDNRLKSTLIKGGAERFNHVLSELNSFISSDEQRDDITFVELSCNLLPELPAVDTKSMDDVLPWSISISLSEKEMIEKNPVSRLFHLLSSLPFVCEYRDVLHVLLYEIYNNTLEHSILNLESINKTDSDSMSKYYTVRDEKIKSLQNAFINFNFSFIKLADKHYLKIEVNDSGTGYQGNQSAPDEALFGRGLDIISHFCDEMSFSDDGKFFTALYKL